MELERYRYIPGFSFRKIRNLLIGYAYWYLRMYSWMMYTYRVYVEILLRVDNLIDRSTIDAAVVVQCADQQERKWFSPDRPLYFSWNIVFRWTVVRNCQAACGLLCGPRLERGSLRRSAVSCAACGPPRAVVRLAVLYANLRNLKLLRNFAF